MLKKQKVDRTFASSFKQFPGMSMKNATNVWLAILVVTVVSLVIEHFTRPSKAQSRGTDVQIISFPQRTGVYWQPDQEYDEEKQLERYFSQGYELEAVIKPTEPKGRPMLIFRR